MDVGLMPSPYTSDLVLWKVNISDEDASALKVIPNDSDIMLPTKKLIKYFTKEPIDEHIHIIVKPPSQTFLICHNSVATITDGLGSLSLQSKNSVCELNAFVIEVMHFWQPCR